MLSEKDLALVVMLPIFMSALLIALLFCIWQEIISPKL